jgi:large subunit ribosomal protein L9
MKVILQENVANLGKVGEIVKVKDGYGRNYLVPNQLAVVADERNVARMEHQRRTADARAQKIVGEAKAVAEKLSQTAVTIRRQAGEENKIFGSVTNRDIAEALAAEGFAIDKKQVVVDESIIKNLGVFNVAVKLAPEVSADVKVYVIAG